MEKALQINSNKFKKKSTYSCINNQSLSQFHQTNSSIWEELIILELLEWVL